MLCRDYTDFIASIHKSKANKVVATPLNKSGGNCIVVNITIILNGIDSELFKYILVLWTLQFIFSRQSYHQLHKNYKICMPSPNISTIFLIQLISKAGLLILSFCIWLLCELAIWFEWFAQPELWFQLLGQRRYCAARQLAVL